MKGTANSVAHNLPTRAEMGTEMRTVGLHESRLALFRPIKNPLAAKETKCSDFARLHFA
jgi:hypothetical protein